MAANVKLYDNAYSHYGDDVYRDVRIQTYGEDLGQTSWVTLDEANEIPRLLNVSAGSRVLEIGCGAGRYALRTAERAGCHIVGVDINAHGVDNANQLASKARLDERVRFQQCDASKHLDYGDASFDAAFANDVLCHVPGREDVFREVYRVLKPGGRFLFSDALVIGGIVSHEEIATRSSIGYYLFSPTEVNDRLLGEAGFEILLARDTSTSAAEISGRWYEARKRRRGDLVAIEGEQQFEGLQKFLECVHRLTSERRLRRYLYLAEKKR